MLGSGASVRAAVLCVAGTALASGQNSFSEEFTTAQLGRDFGFPFYTARSIALTPDGYLWIGGFTGLARFDGNVYQVFDRANTPELPDDAFVRLIADKEGALWAGTNDNIVRFFNGKWQVFGEKEGWPKRMVKSFCLDLKGVLHASTYNRILRYENGRFQDLPSPPAPLADDTNVTCAFDIHGNLWTGWSRRGIGYFGRFADGKWEAIRIKGRDFGGSYRGLGVSRDGRMWVSGDRQAYKLDPKTLAVLAERDYGYSVYGPVELYEDSRGYLWAGDFEKGLVVVTPDGRKLRGDARGGLEASGVFDILEDRDGNMWVAMRSLHRARFRAFRYLGAPEGLDPPFAFGVLPIEGNRILLGGYSLHVLENGRLHPFEAGGRALAPHIAVHAMLRARDGALWAGTGFHGLFRIDGGRVEEIAPFSEERREIWSLFQDKNGRIWVGFQNGVGIVENHKVRALPQTGPRKVSSFAQTSDGTIYLGSNEGLFRLDGGKFVRAAESALHNPVLTLSAPLNALWIGQQGRGLARLQDGKAFTFRPAHGLAAKDVSMIFEDGSFTYLGVINDGIVRARTADLHRIANGALTRADFQLFTRDDGLGSNFQNTPGMPNWARTGDGRVLITRATGIVEMHPDRLPAPPPPPVVRVDSIAFQSAGQDEQAIPASASLSIPYTAERIEIRCAALSLSNPGKLRFQYRLGGSEAGWVDLRSQRSAGFSNLAPGRYHFEMRGANGMGAWSSPAVLEFSVIAPLWRSWWAMALLAIAVGIAVGLAYSSQSRKARVKSRALPGGRK